MTYVSVVSVKVNNPARKTAEEREADRARKGLKKRKDMDKVERAHADMWNDLRTNE